MDDDDDSAMCFYAANGYAATYEDFLCRDK